MSFLNLFLFIQNYAKHVVFGGDDASYIQT